MNHHLRHKSKDVAIDLLQERGGHKAKDIANDRPEERGGYKSKDIKPLIVRRREADTN